MSETQDPVVIVESARTPMGGLLGDLAPLSAAELGSVAIRASLERAGLPQDGIDACLMGCVLPAGQGQAPARQAALGAGLDKATPCVTVNKMCGSGMQTVMMAHDALMAGSHRVVVAGGMESMTNAPHLLLKGRTGMRLGHGEVKDHMFLDGLEDAYEPGRLMGSFADQSAAAYQFSRDQQDAFAIESLNRANRAINDGSFKTEIAPVTLSGRKGDVEIGTDEQPGKANLDRIPALRPAFSEHGTVTAANASSISDGAAALVLMKQSTAQHMGTTPRARILGHAVHAAAPSEFCSAPVGAVRKLLEKTGTTAEEYDLFEVNEAFAVVTMIAMKELGLPHEKTNVHGGACALGHPIGASGARILVTLLAALEKYDLHRGIASLCIGGGEATAVSVERVR